MKRTFIWFLVVPLLFGFVLSCENGGGTTLSLLGTWVNSDYNGGENGGKVVTAHVDGDDYTWAIYNNHDDTVPVFTVNFTVTSETTDSEGNLMVETISYPGDPSIMYSLTKIHADNQTLEYTASEVGYPTEINPAGGDYGIYYRQE
jgi:hypothetical protein